METLQNAYRDEEDDSEITTPDSNPIPGPNPNPLTANYEPGPIYDEPELNSVPMEVKFAENPEALGSEADEKMELLGSEAIRKVEALFLAALGSEDEGNVGALGSEVAGKVGALGSEVSETVEVLGSEELSPGSNSEAEFNTNNALDDNPETSKKQKSNPLDQFDEFASTPVSTDNMVNANENVAKKSSKKKNKNNSVWTKPTSRKNKKKAKNVRINSNNDTNNITNNVALKTEDTVMVTPAPRVPDRIDDSPDSKICISKVCKAEKVELSEDRLSAGSCKGYRMVRATRGVSEGAWFFEIKVVHLGESGHTRLGWSTNRGDLQAPVGYDGCSFGYRDVDGCKVHKALRENYGDGGYKEGDVIGFYINLPEGDLFAPKESRLVLYKGQKYFCAAGSKEDPPKPVPGSEISFYKNGVCQGVAYKDLFGGRYYPAASMYTLPNQPNCVVKFNFGPDFECFPADFEGRPVPRPMIEVPYHGYDNRAENGVSQENKQ